jgi:hypothetical protein
MRGERRRRRREDEGSAVAAAAEQGMGRRGTRERDMGLDRIGLGSHGIGLLVRGDILTK